MPRGTPPPASSSRGMPSWMPGDGASRSSSPASCRLLADDDPSLFDPDIGAFRGTGDGVLIIEFSVGGIDIADDDLIPGIGDFLPPLGSIADGSIIPGIGDGVVLMPSIDGAVISVNAVADEMEESMSEGNVGGIYAGLLLLLWYVMTPSRDDGTGGP
mmetsp:Transcript_19029/g.45688  ORF Transcript_19029/g.45688 Transcript_19029/m.45688 type:complete len:158 (+) Transcript_19029:631-1104(+)